MKAIHIESIQPEPAGVEADARGHSFLFHTSVPGEPLWVFFNFKPERFGKLKAVIRADQDRGAVTIEPFVYP